MTSLFLSLICAIVSSLTLPSPDQRTVVAVQLDSLTISVTHRGTTMLAPSEIGLVLEDSTLDVWRQFGQPALRHEKVVPPLFYCSELNTSYCEIALINHNIKLTVRAYNEGVAYRFTYIGKGKTKVQREVARYQLGDLGNGQRMSVPVLVDRPNGYRTLFTETDLQNYPPMILSQKGEGGALCASFDASPVATLTYRQSTPWRVIGVAENDKQLANNHIEYLLEEPCQLDETDWIRSGQAIWDWWSNRNLTGVSFHAGVNKETYTYYIDFASRYGLAYVIMDEGWSDQSDLKKSVAEINIKELVGYAKKKNVGLILGVDYGYFRNEMEKTCRYYSDMGVAGFKVNFKKSHQYTLSDLKEMAATAAKHHLVLDLQGVQSFNLQRAYPNILNGGCVYSLDELRENKTIDQVRYGVMMPFVRSMVGPVDATQGAMHNATRETFRYCSMEPMGLGTRARQMGEYVVFYSPLTKLCDAPTVYEREDECARAIASVPTTWDETRILDGKVGEYIIIARRKGDMWYIGALNNWSERDIAVNLGQLFPSAGALLHLDLFSDGVNADRNASDYIHEQKSLTSQQLTIHMAPGGGFLLMVRPTTSNHRFATYNVRYVNRDPERADKGERSWSARREALLGVIKGSNIDILGVQEATGNNRDSLTGKSQLEDLKEGLSDYTCIAYERENSDYSYNCIFYRTSRYECLSHESFWLSETPYVVSKGWGSNYYRRCIVALMKDKNTNQQFYFCCAQSDFLPVEAALRQAELIGNKCNELCKNGTPLVLAGDLNFAKKDNPEIYAVYARYFKDSSTSEFPTYQRWTSVLNPDFAGREIDFVFYRNMLPTRRRVVTDDYGRSLPPSDHFPVVVDFQF